MRGVRRRLSVLLLCAGLASALAALGNKFPGPARAAPTTKVSSWACTFSIVAFDPDRKEWGVAVASKYLAVGSAVPWARADVGAIATQSLVNTDYGSQGLDLLAKGESPQAVVKQLTSADSGHEYRQLGLVSATGEVAT